MNIHPAGALFISMLALAASVQAKRQPPPPPPPPAANPAHNPAHFKVEVLAENFYDPMEMVMLPDGRILICQRTGELRVWSPESNTLADAGKLEVAIKDDTSARECGFLGITIDPDFTKNNWIYCYYSLKEISSHRLSRFTFKDSQLDMASEKPLFEIPTDRGNRTCHEAGSLAFGTDGYLYLSTGDNSSPFNGHPSPVNEKNKAFDAQRSASNSNDLRGKILRIDPQDDGTYLIPEGNLFKPGTPKTRPEIYTMGLRNPFRITINPRTNSLFWNEVGPDMTPTAEEINIAKSAGYYGWPYVVADSQVLIDMKKKPYDPKNLRNKSRLNTGIEELPEPRNPLYFYERSCSMIGAVYNKTDAENAFPDFYDNCLFFADWNRSWIRLIRMDKDENMVGVEDFPLNFGLRKPIDMFFDKGVMYVLDYGTGWYDVKNGRLLRISYSTSFNQTAGAEGDPRIVGMDHTMKGVGLMRNTTCLSCHSAQDKSIGPSFVQIVEKYKTENQKDVASKLFDKVRKGGSGVWGDQPMPPHTTNDDKEVRYMIEAILATKPVESGHKE